MKVHVPITTAAIAAGLIAAILVAGSIPTPGRAETPPTGGPQADPAKPAPDDDGPAPDPKTLELCGEATGFVARQDDGMVTIVARGAHPTAGFRVVLEQSPLKIFPPQFVLKHAKPEGPVAQVVTPFRTRAQFKTGSEAVREVIVHDAKGKHTVMVRRGDPGKGDPEKPTPKPKGEGGAGA